MKKGLPLVLLLGIMSCNVKMKMTHIDQDMFEGANLNGLNYTSRSELKNYASQIIHAQKLDFYRIDRKWTIPPIEDLSAAQKVVAYILLDLKLATEDRYNYTLVPEVSFYRRRQDTTKALSDYMSDVTCISTFRTLCPIDRSLVVSVCVEDCAKGGIMSYETVSSINEFESPEQASTIIEALSIAVKNVFYKLSSNKPEVNKKVRAVSMTNSYHHQNMPK